jgi:hypothetical protein
MKTLEVVPLQGVQPLVNLKMNNTVKKLQVFNEREIKYSQDSITGKVLIDLQKRGFSYFFKIGDERIWCEDYNIRFEEFDILEVHSMETTSTEENCILYAIKCDKFNLKGILINQPGIYANVLSGICVTKILNTEKVKLKYYGKIE